MQLIPGADPWSHHGTTTAGALCLHGFTGHPLAMRGVADAFAAAGFHVELPLLPGHGTTVEDMMTTGWADWTEAAEAALARLVERCDSVVVAGLSMGGSLSVYLATKHPNIAGFVLINPLVQPAPDELVEMAAGMLEEGTLSIPGIGSDIADPDSSENSYTATPIGPFLSLTAGLHAMQADLATITAPMLIMTSPQDHVVDPGNSDYLAVNVSGPVERVLLERSYHVATLDYDRDVVFEHAVAFGQKVCAA
jgi:carboxylesterase